MCGAGGAVSGQTKEVEKGYRPRETDKGLAEAGPVVEGSRIMRAGMGVIGITAVVLLNAQRWLGKVVVEAVLPSWLRAVAGIDTHALAVVAVGCHCCLDVLV